MATLDELRVVISAEAGGAVREIDTVNRKVRELGETTNRAKQSGGVLDAIGLGGQSTVRAIAALGGLGLGLNVAAGAAAHLHEAIATGIQSAIDLAEQQNKVAVVFGSSATQVRAFAETADQTLGQTRLQALAAAGTFGNLFTALGLTREQAARMSTQVVQLAADLSSFHNIPVAESLQKLQSGLVGEIEPMRALGVAITETQVQARALAMGFRPVNGELTEAAKVQARYALILEQTKTAQGDFARTSDSLANQQRIAAAAIAEAGTAVGEKFTPLVREATSAAIDLARVLKDVLPPAVDAARQAAITGFPIIGGLAGFRQSLRDARGETERQAAFNDPARMAEAQRAVGLAYDEQGRAIDVLTGKELNSIEITERQIAAEKRLADQRKAARGPGSADIGFLDQKLGKGPIAGTELDEALRRAAIANKEIMDEMRGPITHPLEADRTRMEQRLAELQAQREKAARPNTELARQELEARIGLIPIQQQIAEQDRAIALARNESLQLARQEAVLRAQQAANPANDALNDLQTRQRRLQLQASLRGDPGRGEARRELRALNRSGAITRAEITALDASLGLTAVQRAQRDASIAGDLNAIPGQVRAAQLRIDAAPLEAALAKLQAQQEADAAERSKTVAGLDRSIDTLKEAVDATNRILDGRPPIQITVTVAGTPDATAQAVIDALSTIGTGLSLPLPGTPGGPR